MPHCHHRRDLAPLAIHSDDHRSVHQASVLELGTRHFATTFAPLIRAAGILAVRSPTRRAVAVHLRGLLRADDRRSSRPHAVRLQFDERNDAQLGR